jgi:hypothetical protein
MRARGRGRGNSARGIGRGTSRGGIVRGRGRGRGRRERDNSPEFSRRSRSPSPPRSGIARGINRTKPAWLNDNNSSLMSLEDEGNDSSQNSVKKAKLSKNSSIEPGEIDSFVASNNDEEEVFAFTAPRPAIVRANTTESRRLVQSRLEARIGDEIETYNGKAYIPSL